MTNFKKTAAAGAAAVAVAVCSFAFAQDDLDALLKDLESSEPAAEQPVAVVSEPVAVEALDEPEPVVQAVEPAPVVEEPVEPELVVQPTEPEPVPVVVVASEDDELLANIVATEKLRREAFDVQAHREMEDARSCMLNREYEEAARHFEIALKLLNDSPGSREMRGECNAGGAEAYYRAALYEKQLGHDDKAADLLKKAQDRGHADAGRKLAELQQEQKVTTVEKDVSDFAHRRNEVSYQKQREANRKHLRRSRQLLAVKDIDGALVECELVLVNDKFNEEAIRLRGAIQKKRAAILEKEYEVTHDSMIADVGKAWRPVYAPNARELEAASSSTVKQPLGDDPERAVEQTIIKRMKEMRLPTISFKPPATLIDAIDYFRGASKDFDRPEIPVEQRGFNFILKLPKTLAAQAASEPIDDSDRWGASTDSDSASAGMEGVPVIPMITASDISFYDALKLVCDSVEYKFKVVGPIVTVMHKDMTIDEMQTRSYPVASSFMERMSNASSDMKEMKAAGFGSSSSSRNNDDGEESQERDWKQVFEMLGVQWPEGSSIMYIKANGKLRVKNTTDNLAELEKALADINADATLIEIEARFVEVKQEDLNSLGFEWILNSDYSIGMDNWLGKALNMQGGLFEGSETVNRTLTGYTTAVSESGGTTISTVSPTYQTTITQNKTSGASWIKDISRTASMGLNAMGGTSDDGSYLSRYGNGTRYLSTPGNHISGEGKSTNDQFMRVNAFLGNADLSMILHMLSQRSDTDLLCAPKVLTSPGQEAVIKVVTEYIYPTDYNVQLQSSSSSGSSYGGSQSAVLAVVEPQSFTMREVGVILDVTPEFAEAGHIINLKLNTQVVDEPTWKNYGMRIPFSGNSSLQSFEGIGGILEGLTGILLTLGETLSSTTKQTIAEAATASALSTMDSLSSENSKNIEYYEAPMEQPWFHVRSIDTTVSVYPGATIVMGGLITEVRKAMDDKVPFLGDLPFIGRFFRSHAEQTTKRNLLIFVTTRLVDARGREVILNNTDSSSADVKAAPAPAAE